MRILFDIAALRAGGAQRIMSVTASALAERGRQVFIVTYDERVCSPFFPLHPSITCIALDIGGSYAGMLNAVRQNIRRVTALRRVARELRPDCIIGIGEMNSPRAVLAALPLGIPVIAWEHGNPATLLRERNGRIWDAIRRLTYRKAAAVVAPTRGHVTYFPAQLQRRAVVIPNPVPTDDLIADQAAESSMTQEDRARRGFPADSAALPESMGSASRASAHNRLVPDVPIIAAIGRFVWEKRFDLLLEAFAAVAARHECVLWLFGDGPLKPDLERQIDELGIAEKVFMPGFVQEPWRMLHRAYVLALTSESEGFPMVLLEAMARGVPAISFDCPYGPADIIRNGVDGMLVPPLRTAELARCLERLLSDRALRDRMAAAAPDVLERFSLDRVMAMWEGVIQRVCRKGSG